MNRKTISADMPYRGFPYLSVGKKALDNSSAMLFALLPFIYEIESDLINPKMGEDYLQEITKKIEEIIEDNKKTNEQKRLEIEIYFLERYFEVRNHEGWLSSRLRVKMEEALNAPWLLDMGRHAIQFPENESQKYSDLIEQAFYIRNTLVKRLNNLRNISFSPSESDEEKRYSISIPTIKKHKPKITSIEAFGDSLSDRKTLFKRMLFGFIPMDGLSGLKDRVPQGRFTNGYVWLDTLGTKILQEFIIKELMQDTCVFHQTNTLQEVINCEHNSYRNSYVMVNDFNTKKTIYSIGKNGNYHLVKELNENEAKIILTMMKGKKSHHLTAEEKQEIEQRLDLESLEVRKGMTQEDIREAINTQDNILERACHASFTLDNDKGFLYKGREFMTTYCEGGLTSDDWSNTFTFNPKLLFSRQILSTLKEKRKEAFQHDLAQGTSSEDLDQRLSMVWSSANDLVTVNSHPTYEAAYRAAHAVKLHLIELIRHGRKNIVVANMPDLSLTPRYQQLTGEDGDKEKANTLNVTNYYNKLLNEITTEIRNDQAHCKIEIFDVNKEFTEIYESVWNHENDAELNPLKLRKIKLDKPYKDSPDYKRPSENNGVSPSEGYMFDDDLHPTADVHALLETKFEKFLYDHFKIRPPEEIPMSAAEMVTAFKDRYTAEMRAHDGYGFFALPRTFGLRNSIRQIPADEEGLKEILAYAFSSGKAGRTRQILRDLCWVDEDGKLNKNYPVLLRTRHEMLHPEKQERRIRKSGSMDSVI